MSKAFTKDSDDPLDGVLVVEPPRPSPSPGGARKGDDAALPPGEINYLTPGGAATLRADIERLRAAPRGEPRHRLAIEQRLAALLRRLEAAQVIDPLAQPADRVLFGATVTVRDADARERVYRIVGVDEADARRGWVSWRSPMARALLNLRAGEVANVHTPGGDSALEIVSIAYES